MTDTAAGTKPEKTAELIFDGIIQHPEPKDGHAWLACKDCGQLVKDPQGTAEWVETDRAEVMLSDGIVHTREWNGRIPMALCPECRKRRQRASDLMVAHPLFLRTIGSRALGDERMDSALVVLEVLGVTDDLDRASGRDIRLALKNLSGAGFGVRWSARFAPVLKLGTAPNTTAASRWSFLTEEQLQRLRDAAARFMRARIFSSAMIPPPAAGDQHAAARGCLLCGVSHVKISEQDERPWGDIVAAQPTTLRGRGMPDLVWGYLCPTCRKAMEWHGVQSLGLNALDAALVDYFDVVKDLDAWSVVGGFDRQRELFVSKLKAWCVTGREPNMRPWAHLGDPAVIRGLLDAF